MGILIASSLVLLILVSVGGSSTVLPTAASAEVTRATNTSREVRRAATTAQALQISPGWQTT